MVQRDVPRQAQAHKQALNTQPYDKVNTKAACYIAADAADGAACSLERMDADQVYDIRPSRALRNTARATHMPHSTPHGTEEVQKKRTYLQKPCVLAACYLAGVT